MQKEKIYNSRRSRKYNGKVKELTKTQRKKDKINNNDKKGKNTENRTKDRVKEKSNI